MRLKSVAHRVVDPVQREYRRWMFRRSLASLRTQVRSGGEVSPALLGRLHHWWSNDAWSVEPEFLDCMLRWLPETSGAVLECGSGLTTLVLAVATAGTGREVVSLEHDADWAARVRAALPAGGHNVDIALAPIRSYGDFDWYDGSAIERGGPFGFVVCDGPPGSTRGRRYGFAPVMQRALAPGCIVLFDDINRAEERATIARWCDELPAVALEAGPRICVLRVGAQR